MGRPAAWRVRFGAMGQSAEGGMLLISVLSHMAMGVPTSGEFQKLVPELGQAGQDDASIYTPISFDLPQGVEGNGAQVPVAETAKSSIYIPETNYRLVPGSVRALQDIERSMAATGAE